VYDQYPFSIYLFFLPLRKIFVYYTESVRKAQ